MSITYKGVLNKGANISSDGSLSTSMVLVYLFDAAENSVDILKQSQIPIIGQAHPSDQNLVVNTIACSDPMEGDTVKKAKYEVTVTYIRRQKVSVGQGGNRTVAPWKLPPYNISVSPLEYVVAFQKAYTVGDLIGRPSKAVLNTANDPYEESTTRQNILLRFSYNLETFNSSWAADYSDTVNLSSVNIVDRYIDAKCGRIKNLSSSRQIVYDENGDVEYRFSQVDVEIEIARSIWKKEVLCRGLYFLNGGNKYRIYTDNAGNFGKQSDMGANAVPVDEPQRLGPSGELYTGADGTAYYQEFEDKKYLNWNPLSFPKTELG